MKIAGYAGYCGNRSVNFSASSSVRSCHRQCLSSCFHHQPSYFKVGTALFIEFRPMAAFASWRQALRQSAIGKTLQGVVYPAKTQCLLHHIDIRQAIATLSRASDAVHGYPSFLIGSGMLLKPFTPLRTMAKLEKVGNFHLLSPL